jgi:hypothetical protein
VDLVADGVRGESMSRLAVLALGLVALVGCNGSSSDDLVSSPLAEPTVVFDVVPPDVDTDWPLSGDTDE